MKITTSAEWMINQLATEWDTTPETVLELAVIYLDGSCHPLTQEETDAVKNSAAKVLGESADLTPWAALNARALTEKMRALSSVIERKKNIKEAT